MVRKVMWAGALALAGIGGVAAVAQEMRPTLGSAAAQQAIEGCKAYALEHGHAVTIAVLDEGGNLKALLRMDGAGLGTVEMAQWKAKSAAGFSVPTTGFAAMAGQVAGLADAPGIAAVGGGEPMFASDGKAPLGAVGVSGAITEEADAACARAGIEAAGLKTAG